MKINPEAQEVEPGQYIAWHYSEYQGCSRPESRLVTITDLASLKKHVAEAWAKRRREEHSTFDEASIEAAADTSDLKVSIMYRHHSQAGDIVVTDGPDCHSDWYLMVKVEGPVQHAVWIKDFDRDRSQDPDWHGIVEASNQEELDAKIKAILHERNVNFYGGDDGEEPFNDTLFVSISPGFKA